MDSQAIKPDMLVHARNPGDPSPAGGAPVVQVGTVDHLDGDRWIKLARRDADDGRHHWIPLDWVERADEKGVFLSKSADEFKRERADEPPAPLN